MADVPRRLAQSGADKVDIIADRVAPGSHRGISQWSRPPTSKTPTPQGGALFAQVIHGDDGTVLRPPAMIVYWLGAAFPDNAADYDFWYTANI
jgi:hypothetical protein